MDQPQANVAPGSLLHRVLRITPGHASQWVCSRDSCTGLDLLVAAEVGAVFGALLLGHFHGQWWFLAVAVLAVVAFWAVVHEPFESRERWGRARRRRGECVWCGHAGVGPGTTCQRCASRA